MEDGVIILPQTKNDITELLNTNPEAVAVRLYFMLERIENDFTNFVTKVEQFMDKQEESKNNESEEERRYKQLLEYRVRSLEDWKLKMVAVVATMMTVSTLLGQVVPYFIKRQ